jgi:hypothetical protein
MSKLDDIYYKVWALVMDGQKEEDFADEVTAEVKALFLELVDNTAQLYLYEEGSEKVAEFINDLNKVINEL